MYDFRYKINDHQRFNTYEIYIKKDENSSIPYKTVRNSLFFIILILIIFIMGAFIQKSYQNKTHHKSIIVKKIEIKKLNTSR
jgi:hypothetical protein